MNGEEPGMKRCPWAEKDPLYIQYHDEEWGMPVHEDRTHFEFLVLESAQAGLSWLTILRRREAYRAAYEGFDPALVARFDAEKVELLLSDGGIIKNRNKIESSVHNARLFVELQRDFGSFDSYLWGFVGGRPVQNRWESVGQIPAWTGLSERIADDLRKRGFRFIGPTILYSHLQAVGVVNDHLVSCFRYQEIRTMVDGRRNEH
jgi:DNA-3-methyladenine glycosylase I